MDALSKTSDMVTFECTATVGGNTASRDHIGLAAGPVHSWESGHSVYTCGWLRPRAEISPLRGVSGPLLPPLLLFRTRACPCD